MVDVLATVPNEPSNRSHRRSAYSLGPLVATVMAVTCAWLFFPSSPSVASAAGRGKGGGETLTVVRAFPYSRFQVHGTRGYQILVTGTPNGVRLIASRRHRAVEYLDPLGQATATGINANFGHLGHIAVKFRSNGKRPTHPPAGELRNCRYVGRNRERLGSFVGRIYFRGERGYTSVQLRGAHGRSGFDRLLRCSKNRLPIHAASPQPRIFL